MDRPHAYGKMSLPDDDDDDDDKAASIIHWRLCKKYGVDVHKNWYRHVPLPVIENEKVKILWDVNIYTDRVIQARRPDIVVVDKCEKRVTLIDMAVPADKNILEKEKEKVIKYQDLKMELKRLWKMKVKVIPVVIGALGSVSKNLKNGRRNSIWKSWNVVRCRRLPC